MQVGAPSKSGGPDAADQLVEAGHADLIEPGF